MSTGKEISNHIVMALRAAGYLVYVFNGRMPRGSNGWVDVVAIKNGIILLIEIKGEHDRLRPKQIELKEYIENNPIKGVIYILAESEEDVYNVMEVV